MLIKNMNYYHIPAKLMSLKLKDHKLRRICYFLVSCYWENRKQRTEVPCQPCPETGTTSEFREKEKTEISADFRVDDWTEITDINIICKFFPDHPMI